MPEKNITEKNDISTWSFTLADGRLWGVRIVFRSLFSTSADRWDSYPRNTQMLPTDVYGYEAYGFANPQENIAFS